MLWAGGDVFSSAFEASAARLRELDRQQLTLREACRAFASGGELGVKQGWLLGARGAASGVPSKGAPLLGAMQPLS